MVCNYSKYYIKHIIALLQSLYKATPKLYVIIYILSTGRMEQLYINI